MKEGSVLWKFGSTLERQLIYNVARHQSCKSNFNSAASFEINPNYPEKKLLASSLSSPRPCYPFFNAENCVPNSRAEKNFILKNNNIIKNTKHRKHKYKHWISNIKYCVHIPNTPFKRQNTPFKRPNTPSKWPKAKPARPHLPRTVNIGMSYSFSLF